MIPIAAIVPTRGRALLARRAVLSFLSALGEAAPGAEVHVVIADDSDSAEEYARLLFLKAEVEAARSTFLLDVLPPPAVGLRTVSSPGGGPGATRNRALAWLKAYGGDHDVTVMFDDDVCFADTVCLGEATACDGVALIKEALALASRPGTVAGCGYVGRQDLSILEHIRLDDGSGAAGIAASLSRGDVEEVAPAGISTAFLAVGSPVNRLPAFPEHYNEDFVWLHALRRAGWPLERTTAVLAHAPTGVVEVTAPSLSFQIFGEIVWLAVVEEARFPADTVSGLAAAIDEIVRDLDASLRSTAVRRHGYLGLIVDEVRRYYADVGIEVREGGVSSVGDALRTAILEGLALAPVA